MEVNASLPYIDIHTHSAQAVRDGGILEILSALEPVVPENGFFSAGLHPQDIGKYEFSDFKNLFENPRCVMIGECGLDRTLSSSIPVQTELFLRHAETAETLEKGLVIHCVRSNQEIIRLKKDFSPKSQWIIHGFRGNERKANEFIDAGFMLSFGYGLARDAGNVEKYFRNIPKDKILLETDGQADIKAIYALAASFLEMGIDELKKQIIENCTFLSI